MDDLDRKILEILKEDGRISFKDLGKKLGISDVAAKKRVDKLLKLGVIRRFTIDIDQGKIGKPIHAFLLVKTNPKEGEVIKDLPYKSHITLGSYDAILEVFCKDIDELKRITEEVVGGIRGVNEVRALVVVE